MRQHRTAGRAVAMLREVLQPVRPLTMAMYAMCFRSEIGRALSACFGLARGPDQLAQPDAPRWSRQDCLSTQMARA